MSQIKTSSVKIIEMASPPTYAWTDKTGKEIISNRYDVTMANGEKLTFLAVGNFKKALGEEIIYEKTSDNYGRIKKQQQQFNSISYDRKILEKKPESTQTYIITQNSASNACNYFSNKNATPGTIIDLARQLEQYVLNG